MNSDAVSRFPPCRAARPDGLRRRAESHRMERKRIASAKGKARFVATWTCGVIEAGEAFSAADGASVVDMAKGSSTPLLLRAAAAIRQIESIEWRGPKQRAEERRARHDGVGLALQERSKAQCRKPVEIHGTAATMINPAINAAM
ncbi:hypothetical protein ACFFYR_36800 [Paraburkholderia dipogonis]|uniref:hypothetical protein n=1 Tax=Paraburkholderia dipogonis TaxID=1211383 RepID=UPI0035E4EA6F